MRLELSKGGTCVVSGGNSMCQGSEGGVCLEDSGLAGGPVWLEPGGRGGGTEVLWGVTRALEPVRNKTVESLSQSSTG